jgi:hemoglobin-like flavoprotein
MSINRQAIEDSLELVAAACEDPTPKVYERLFQKFPEVEPLFILDENDSAKGHMQFQAIECVLDLVGPRTYATTLIQSERINHDGLGVPVETFSEFFPVLKDTFQEIAGESWTGEHEAAWGQLLNEIHEIIETTF